MNDNRHLKVEVSNNSGCAIIVVALVLGGMWFAGLFDGCIPDCPRGPDCQCGGEP